MTQENVIIVNERDEWLGIANKMAAHKEGLLHRAFSVFVLNSKNELLIQKRADGKYHSAGLWSNACCSHPRQGESTMAAAHRRLQEELGFDCTVEEVFTFRYKADVGDGLIENEYDHVYVGYYDGEPVPNNEEVSAVQYISIDKLLLWIEIEPTAFTMWFKMVMPEFVKHMTTHIKAA